MGQVLITADQIVAHLVGDYILQSDWMATEKTRKTSAAAVHAITYSLPFLCFRPSLAAFALIVLSHFVIDRWRVVRYLCWAKNFIGPPPYAPWRECQPTGYWIGRPVWLTTWLMIVADNTLHLILNGVALKWL